LRVPLHILVVDDHDLLREVLATALRGRGAAVDVAATAEEGSALLERSGARRYDVVVSDWQMPGADGLWLLRRVGAASPGTRRVLITGGGLDALRAAVEHGPCAGTEPFDAALAKPIDPRELWAAVQGLAAAG
jgi:two-component system response regulator RegA